MQIYHKVMTQDYFNEIFDVEKMPKNKTVLSIESIGLKRGYKYKPLLSV